MSSKEIYHIMGKIDFVSNTTNEYWSFIQHVDSYRYDSEIKYMM